jgi:hypothetical protein
MVTTAPCKSRVSWKLYPLNRPLPLPKPGKDSPSVTVMTFVVNSKCPASVLVGLTRLRANVPLPPPKPSTEMKYVVPATAVNDAVLKLVALKTSLVATTVRLDTFVPVNTPSNGVKLKVGTEKLAGPDRGAVHWNHTDAPPCWASALVSPGSRLAPTFEFVTVPRLPYNGVGEAKLSLVRMLHAMPYWKNGTWPTPP